MKIIALASFALALLNSACGASSSSNSGLSSPTEPRSDCVFDERDPFEPRSRLPRGPNQGLCHDTTKARSLVRLTGAMAQRYGANPLEKDVLTVANISHNGKFYVGHIPLAGLKNAIFHLEYFPAVVPAGHTQLRLQFSANQAVRLVPQSGSQPSGNETITDLILSVEALGQPGYQYDIKKGIEDHFGAVYRMTSLKEKYVHMVANQQHRVEQWRLNMSQAEMRTILERYVEKSESVGMNEMYHTLKLNCTNELMAAIDAGMDYTTREKVGKFLAKTTDFYPNVIRISLIRRGLLPLGKRNDLVELANDPVAASFADNATK